MTIDDFSVQDVRGLQTSGCLVGLLTSWNSRPGGTAIQGAGSLRTITRIPDKNSPAISVCIEASTSVCRRKMEKLVRGYYLDSLDDAVLFEKIDIAAILEEPRNTQHNDLGTVGKGTERRFEAVHVQGSWKEVEGSIQHLIILPKRAEGGPIEVDAAGVL